MKCQGQIKGLSRDYRTNLPEVTLLMEGSIEDIERYGDKRLNVEITEYRHKRSPEANSYFWVLCTKIAEVIGQSVQYVHNDMIRKYGQIELVDDKAVYLVLPESETAIRRTNEAESYCLRPTSEVKVGKDGKMYRTYMMMRGSHDYNTKEMSVLIDGVVQEAKGLGIETMGPKQLERMMILYGKKHP